MVHNQKQQYHGRRKDMKDFNETMEYLGDTKILTLGEII